MALLGVSRMKWEQTYPDIAWALREWLYAIAISIWSIDLYLALRLFF